MKALIIGAGGVGSAIANIASRRSFLTQVIIADHDKQRAENAVARLNGDPRFTAAQVDASQVQAVEELLRTHRPDVVINAVDPRFVMPIFLACEYEEVNYVDMAMSLSKPHPLRPYTEAGVKLGDEQFARDWNWGELGIWALVGMGVEPGLSDVFAKYASDHIFSRIDEVKVLDGSNIVVEGYEFAPSFSIWTTIEECLNPPLVWEDGGDSEPDDRGQREAGHRGPLHRSRCGQPLAHEPHRAAGAGPVPVGAADAVGVVVRVVHADLQQQRDSCRARGESPGRLTAHHRPGAGGDDRSQSQRQRPRPCAGDPVAGGGHR